MNKHFIRLFYVLLIMLLVTMANLAVIAQDDEYDDDDSYSEEYYDDEYYDECDTDEDCEYYYDEYYDGCETDEDCEYYYDECDTDEDCEYYDDEYYDGCETDEDCEYYEDEYIECETDEECDFYEEYYDFEYEDYVYCETDEECDALYADCEADPDCIIFYEDEYGDFIEEEDFSDNFDTDSEAFSSEDVEAFFEVDNGTLLGNPTADQQALWDFYANIIPPQWVNRISAFEITTDPELSGYVYTDENDPTKFVLGLNIEELSDPSELTHTVIHEFAHILTLNPAQVDGVLAMGGGSCATLELDEGCTSAASYINQFDSQLGVFANGGGSNFVSEYASTNIAEDIAESFTAFILQDRPTGDSVAEQKINFFYNFPELIQLRQQLRANIAGQG